MCKRKMNKIKIRLFKTKLYNILSNGIDNNINNEDIMNLSQLYNNLNCIYFFH